MIECSKCSGSCEDNALYCVHCGARLDTKACKGCGDYVPDNVDFCAKCGYPTKGTICPRCGNKNPDEAKFCIKCGTQLGGVAQTAPIKQQTYASEQSVQQTVAVAQERVAKPRNGQNKKEFGFMVARLFVLPTLLLCIFISSFFGMFKVYVPFVNLGGSDVFVDIKVDATGFDAVRAMFILANPPTEEELMDDWNDYLYNHADALKVSEAGIKKEIRKNLSSFGALRYSLYEESIQAETILQVIVLGLQALSLMVISFVFFIITLVHAINVMIKRKDGIYKHETMPLALLTVITFAFVMTGGMLAGAAWAIFFLGLIGLSFILFTKYFAEKMPKPTLAVNLRRGICAGLVVLLAFFATSSLITSSFGGTKSSMDTDFLYAMEDPFEGEEDYISYEDLLLRLNDIRTDSDYRKSDRVALYRMFTSPTILCFMEEAKDSFATPAIAMSWLLFIFNMFFAAMLSILLYRELQDEANPQAKRKKNLLWYILTFAGVAGILGCTIPFIVMGNSISQDLEMGIKYSISAFPIVAIIFALGALVTYAVMKGIENNKNKPRQIYQSAYAPVPPANNYVPPAPAYVPNPNPEPVASPAQDTAASESAAENQTAANEQKE